MRTLFVTFLLALSLPAFADWVIMTPEEKQLNERFSASATRDDAVIAFNSRHFLLQQRASEWLLVNRDISTWNSLRDQKEKLKEVSRQLYPILDYLAKQDPEPNKPLALILPQMYFNLLLKKDDQVPPRDEYAYLAPPIDEVLYRILAEDLNRFPSSNGLTAKAAHLLLEYRAPSEKLEQAVKLKSNPSESGDHKEKEIETPQQLGLESTQPTSTFPPPPNERPEMNTRRSDSSARSVTTWIVAITAAFCITLAAGFSLRKKF